MKVLLDNSREDLVIALEYLGLYIDITRPLDFYEIIESLALHGIYVTNIELLLNEYQKVLDHLEERRRKAIDKVFSKTKCRGLEDLKGYLKREAELGYKKKELKKRALEVGWNIENIKKSINFRDLIVKRNRNFIDSWREKIDNVNDSVEVIYT